MKKVGSIGSYLRKIKINIYSIRLKLICVFLLPISFLILLGIISYQLASKGLIKNYETNAVVSLDMMSEYYVLGLNNISGKVISLVTDNTVQQYYSGYYSNSPAEEASRKGEVQKKVLAIDAADKFISDIYVFADYGYPVSSAGTIPTSFYEEFNVSEEAKALADSGETAVWVGAHPSIDSTFPNNKSGYALTYIKKLSNTGFQQIGCIVADVDQAFIMDILKKTEFGDKSITGFVEKGGKAVLNGSYKEGFDISTEAFYDKAVKGTSELGSEYVSFNKKSYLFIYSKLDIGNAMVFALIPRSEVTSQAESVKLITVIAVIISSIIALAIGLLIANGIGTIIHKTNHALSVASTGDLTVNVAIKRKDEFSILGQSINHMLKSMKALIEKMLGVSKSTAASAQEVAGASQILLATSKNIASAVSDIESGVQQQAVDAENCLLRMSDLANQITVVQDSTEEIDRIAGNTKKTVIDGLISMKDLSDKGKDTSEITRSVIRNIEKLEEESIAVIDIIRAMNEITDQTNLLSLNAMIEAARAGTYGRGFAVVADEIRKLSEKSAKEAKNIKEIIEKIQNRTKDTVKEARKAENIVAAQEMTLQTTMSTFDDINRHVENLADNLNKISLGIEAMGKAKEDTLSAIENISSTLEETVAASTEVSTTAENQLSSVEQLNQAAVKLGYDASNLEETVNVFHIY
jgi:methyl-accepting chemotaxis protein